LGVLLSVQKKPKRGGREKEKKGPPPWAIHNSLQPVTPEMAREGREG